MKPDPSEVAYASEAIYDEQYPEHAKLGKVRHESQAIGTFLDFGLGRQGLQLAEADSNGNLWPTSKPIPDILCEYYGLDAQKLEDEKRQMLRALAEISAKRTRKESEGEPQASEGTGQGS